MLQIINYEVSYTPLTGVTEWNARDTWDSDVILVSGSLITFGGAYWRIACDLTVSAGVGTLITSGGAYWRIVCEIDSQCLEHYHPLMKCLEGESAHTTKKS